LAEEHRLAASVVSELILGGLVTLFLIVATVWILWRFLVKINPDEARDIQPFLTFVLVVVPFVMIIYFGLAVINYDAMAGLSGWPLVLPLDSLLSPLIAGALAFYIGQTMWLWWDWRKLPKPR
jgi:heme/copper-type cytochrome/quinol oxidase subunit 2